LDIATQTHLRRTVVQAVRAGMSQTRAAEVFGVSPTSPRFQ
jgi:transposase